MVLQAADWQAGDSAVGEQEDSTVSRPGPVVVRELLAAVGWMVAALQERE